MLLPEGKFTLPGPVEPGTAPVPPTELPIPATVPMILATDEGC